jgi:hypothetical protein
MSRRFRYLLSCWRIRIGGDERHLLGDMARGNLPGFARTDFDPKGSERVELDARVSAFSGVAAVAFRTGRFIRSRRREIRLPFSKPCRFSVTRDRPGNVMSGDA